MKWNILISSAFVLFTTNRVTAQNVEPNLDPKVEPAAEAKVEAVANLSTGETSVVKTTVKTKEFNVPLYFDVVGEDVELPPLELDYNLETDDGNSIRVGNIKIDSGNFYADILPLSRLDSRLQKILPKSSSTESVFLFRWPDNLMREGRLEMISRTGRVIWTVNIDQKAQLSWKNQLDTWKKALQQSKVPASEVSKAALFKTQFGIRNLGKAESPFWKVDEAFRFCFLNKEGNGQTRLCSTWFEVRKSQKQIRLSSISEVPVSPRVIVNDQDGKLADVLLVEKDKPVRFFAEIRSGLSFEFFALPKPLNLYDMVKSKDGKSAIVITEGDHPLSEASQLRMLKYSNFEEIIGWQQTIGDFRKFWKFKVSLAEPFIMIPGEGGGAFKQRLVIKQLPSEDVRPYLSRYNLETTYVDGVKLFGKKNKETQVETKENSVEVEKGKSSYFTWKFQAKNRGELNRSYLNVKEEDHSFKAYHEVYKGYPREISFRMSGVADSAGGLSILSEVAFNYWFEDVFGWTNYYLARERWGLSTKAFRSLTNIKISAVEDYLQVYNIDLKYRFNPGLWGRDETWGLYAGYENVTYNIFTTGMFGAGIFWARSMPKVFDEIANKFPFMNYPKWVDMEFIYYPVSLDSGYTLRGPGGQEAGMGNWQLNFHGQVEWTKSFFGEAGFGVKQYDFVREKTSPTSRRVNFTLTSFYGTVGLGYKF